MEIKRKLLYHIGLYRGNIGQTSLSVKVAGPLEGIGEHIKMNSISGI